MKLITVRFVSPFKIGEREDYVDAVTLYRAFIKALAMLGESFSEIMEGKVKFSSMFPVINGTLYVKTPYRKVECKDREKDKRLRRIGFIRVDVLKKAEPPYTFRCRENSDEIYVQDYNNQEFALKGSDYLESHGRTIVEYKNRIDRVNHSADIYSTPSFMPAYDMGFLATEWNGKLERALRLLEKLGIGKDRNLGYGKFVVKGVTDFDISLSWRYKYVTGKAYTEGDFLAERFDRAQIIGGDVSPVFFPIFVLLPPGSLVKETKRLVERRDDNVVIVDPIAL
ncbi:MAG: type III-A CRISPR-associated RAMP protein Csm4 [Thermoprotei archaeon]